MWRERLASGAEQKRTLNADVAQIEKSTQQLLNRIVGTDVDSVIAVYENKIRQLQEERIVGEGFEPSVFPYVPVA